MKKFRILILIIAILFMCGCEREDLNSAYKITDRIVDSLQNSNPDLSSLNKKEKKIYQNIMDANKEENYVVDLSKIKTYEPNTEIDEIDTSNDDFVYEEDGDLKIKYTNINWYETDETEYFMVNIDGETREIYKDLVPILYDDTSGKINYTYKYMNYKRDKDYTYFYYKSLTNFGGLTFVVNNRNIEDMTLVYSYSYDGEEIKNDNTTAKLVEALVIVIIIFAVLFVGILIFYNTTSQKIANY